MTRRDVDWAAVEAAWRSGRLSATAIGRVYGVSRNTVIRRARQHGWTRAEAVPVPVGTGEPRTPPVLAGHRAVIGQGQALTRRLLEEALALSGRLRDDEPDDGEAARQDALERAAAFPKRTAALRDLAVAARLWIALEREAWGLDGTSGDEAPRLDFDAALRLLDPEEREQLRRIAEILAVRAGDPAA